MTAEPSTVAFTQEPPSGVLILSRARHGALRVAIVGAGPSGFYTAAHLLAARDVGVEIDVFERLPTPWGLVRAGVAPDHPKIKSVARVFEKTAADSRVRFLGNVEIGTDVTHDELVASYDAVVYAVGTAAGRRLGIPGEDLPGSWSATDFVGWYNGHPDFRDLDPDLSAERAVVIGNGNVAVDVARILTLDPAALATTDIADHALEALAGSRVREVVILGRRGPEQAAFTTPELLELGALNDIDVIVDPSELALEPELRDAGAGATARRNLEILADYATRGSRGSSRRIVLRFLASPRALLGDSRLEAVDVVRNRLERDGDGVLRARVTANQQTLPAGLVLRAIGYAGIPLPRLPFDARTGTIPNERGRVAGAGPGVYVAGWIKRGPTGVIGTNKKCAQETAATLLEDAATGRLGSRRPVTGGTVDAKLAERGVHVVSYAGWQAIDRHERNLGERVGRLRVKLTRVEEMLEVASMAPAPVALHAA